MKFFIAIIITLTFVEISSSASKEGIQIQEEVSANHKHHDSSAESSTTENEKNTHPNSSLNTKPNDQMFSKNIEQSNPKQSKEIPNIPKNDSSPSTTNIAEDDNTSAINLTTLEVTAVTTSSPASITKNNEESIDFNINVPAITRSMFNTNGDSSSTFRSSERSLKTNETSTATENPIDRITGMTAKSILNDGNVDSAELNITSTDFDDPREDKEKLVSVEMKNEKSVDLHAEDENVGGIKQEESIQNNPETAQSLKNSNTSMFSAKLENIDHVNISEGSIAVKINQEKQNKATTAPELKDLAVSEIVKVESETSSTEKINFSSPFTTKVTDKSIVVSKIDSTSSMDTLLININDDESTSAETDVSTLMFNINVEEKSSQNIATILNTTNTTTKNNTRKDQANLLDVIREPLTIRMTNEQNFVTEEPKNSSTVSAFAIKKYDYLVPKNENVSCILASMELVLSIPYTTVDEKMVMKEIQMPSLVRVSGKCMDDELHSMTFSWIEGSTYNKGNSIKFNIMRDEEFFYVNKVDVSVFLDEGNFPDAADIRTTGSSTVDLRLFPASIKDGIHVCHSKTEIQCGMIGITIKDISFIAYNDEQDVSYRKEEQCTPTKSVQAAIIVGSIIGIVVILGFVILLSYFKSRSNTFKSELP